MDKLNHGDVDAWVVVFSGWLIVLWLVVAADADAGDIVIIIIVFIALSPFVAPKIGIKVI